MSVTGELALRKENIDHAVKAVALRTYKLKNLCTVDTSSAWTETYFRESNTELSGTTTGGGAFHKVKGVAKNAPFPYGEASWTKVSGINEKYAMEGLISYEDELMGNVPMIARTVLRIGRAPVYAVDNQIAAVMLASAGNSVAIIAGYEWDSATFANRLPVYNILQAIDQIQKDNIEILDGSGYLCLNGTDFLNLMSNSQVMNNPTFKSADVVTNGVVGEICGLKIVNTEALEVTTPDVAYVVKGQEAMTWKEVVPLTTEVIRNPGINTTIRAWEIGQCQMVMPDGVCKITNTRK